MECKKCNRYIGDTPYNEDCYDCKDMGKLQIVFSDKGTIEYHIEGCEGKHIQQVVYSTYHKALTQICFGCKKVRTSLTEEETKQQNKEIEKL